VVLAAGDLHPVPVDLADAPVALAPPSVRAIEPLAVAFSWRCELGHTVQRPTLSLLRQHCALIV